MKTILFIFSLILILCLTVSSIDAEPSWEPGNPSVLLWSEIQLKIFWPWSETGRGDEYRCLVKVYNPNSGFHTLTLRGQPGPENEHVILSVVWWFGSGFWTLRDGSCFMLQDGSVRYTKPIVGLPHKVFIVPGPRVFMPSLKGGTYFLTADGEKIYE